MDPSVSDTLGNAHAVLHGHADTMPVHTTRSDEYSQLIGMMNTINQSLQTGFAKLENRIDLIQGTLNSVVTDVNHLKSSVNIMESEVNGIKNDHNELKKEMDAKIAALEKARLEAELYSRKSNLLFFDVPQAETVLQEDTESVMRSHLESMDFPRVERLQFINVHRLPTRSESRKPDPIIVKFLTMKDRNSVLNYKPTNSKKLAVAPHLPTSMQNERKRLIPIRNRKRAEGHSAKISVKGIEVRLLVNNVPYEN